MLRPAAAAAQSAAKAASQYLPPVRLVLEVSFRVLLRTAAPATKTELPSMPTARMQPACSPASTWVLLKTAAVERAAE